MALSRQPGDLKNKVITCLNRLADRDTLSAATNELESIARGLSNDGYAHFLSYISSTDSSEKSPVRRQCVRLVAVLSAAHGDALSPHLSKMLSVVLRRLRDPDSAVRSACVEAVSAIASQITKPPFSSIVKPLIDSIFREQEYNSQIGASLCLAAAVDASPEPEPAELKKLLPRLLKLVRSDSFKAKPALLSLIGSIVSVGGASSKHTVNSLLPTLIDFLSSDDWATRKAAAEALAKLAVAERGLLPEFKSSCLASLESRKFDKVKVVRETMNRALAMWKQVPGVADADEFSPQSPSKSSQRDCSSGGSSTTSSGSSPNLGPETPQLQKTFLSGRSPASSTISTPRRSPLKCDYRTSSGAGSNEADNRISSGLKAELGTPPSLNVAYGSNEKTPKAEESNQADNRNSGPLRPEARRVLFSKNSNDRSDKLGLGAPKFRSRVVPIYENEACELNTAENNPRANVDEREKEFQDISLIRRQLEQIENQQSNLLDLLQKFIGSSRHGMNSLEKRVNGLEKVLDEMQQDLAISTGKFSNAESMGNTCCILPHAEFLSPKFWRKTEGQNSNMRSPFSSKSQTETSMHDLSNKDDNFQLVKQYGSRKHQTGNLSCVNSAGKLTKESTDLPYSNPNKGAHRILRA